MSPALDWQPGLDVEVEDLPGGGCRWSLYDRARLVASGRSRSAVGLYARVWLAYLADGAKPRFNRRFPYHRLCLHRWCLRGQTYQHRCHRHQEDLDD